MFIFVGAAVRWRDLLDGGSRRQLTRKYFAYTSSNAGVSACYRGKPWTRLAEIHIGFFEIIHLVAHRLAELEGGGGAVDSTVRSGDKPLFAEQYSVSPAKTQGLAVGLGGMFLGRTARRCFRSRTATPVYSICAPLGRLETSIVARAGVLPNSKRCA
jgi:hypothetical protein